VGDAPHRFGRVGKRSLEREHAEATGPGLDGDLPIGLWAVGRPPPAASRGDGGAGGGRSRLSDDAGRPRRARVAVCHVVDGEVLLDKDELVDYRSKRPERRVASTYDRLFDDPHQDTPEEPYVAEIHRLAKSGLAGAPGAVAAMGVPRDQLPKWDDLQILTAQLHRFRAWTTRASTRRLDGDLRGVR
jgi:hypothetical protein